MLLLSTPPVRDVGAPVRNVVEAPAIRRRVSVQLVVALTILGAIAVVTVPNYLNAIQRGRQKRTMSEMRTIATAFESYSIDNKAYPTIVATGSAALEEIAPRIEPTYVKVLPRLDGWGHPFEVTSSAGEYTVMSLASDGKPDTPDGPHVGSNGQTTDFRSDLIFSTGSFVQYPDGTMQ